MRRRTELCLLAAVFCCVAAAHIWMIWMAPTALSFSVRHVHTDNAVILLMGKHMLEKGEFPIFYYGQDWFGSLSAMVHAVVFFVLGGIPPWSIHVAPLLFFLGFCLVLYGLARDVFGPAVAVWALAWNIATPVRLSEYTVLPHGGYVESLMLGTLLLWLSVRLVRAQGTARKNAYYALLGFTGGLAWWTSPLVVYQILASAVFVVMRERVAAVVKGTLLSVPAFFIGAAPFFYFYAVDPYSNVLSMGGGFRLANIPGGLRLFLLERLPQYLDWELFRSAIPFAPAIAGVVYGMATLYFLWHLRKSFSARHPLRSAAIFPVFVLVFTLLLAASVHVTRDAPQYALPLSAFFPVALGFWLVHAQRLWRVVACGGSAALFLLHGWTTAAWVAHDAPRAEALTAKHLALIQALEAKGVQRLYTSYTYSPGSELLNFYARKRIVVSEAMGERYTPYFDALEREPEPAFLYPGGADSLTPTLTVLGASAEREQIGTYDLIRRVRGRNHRYRQIPATGFRASASHEAPATGHVWDRDMDTFWTSGQLRKPGMWVEFDLGQPFTVGMVRLWNPGQYHGYYAMDVRVETSVDGRLWHDAVTRSPMHYFHWSGPRVYPWEWGYRWETVFAPVQARRIRITQYEDSGRFPWMIGEAYVYEDLGPRDSGPAGEPELLRRIADLGLDRVYADRWMSAKIAEHSQGRIATVTPFTIAISAFYVRLRSRVVQWSPATAFVLADSDADEFERVMQAEDVRLAREDFGRWVLFHFRAPGASLAAVQGDPGWWWMGLGVVKTHPKVRSRHPAAKEEHAYREGRLDRAVELSRRAVRAYPFTHERGR
jgi:F5/8 type C domain